MYSKDFIQRLYERHAAKSNLPSPQLVESFLEELMGNLFPAYNNRKVVSPAKLLEDFDKNKQQLVLVLEHIEVLLEQSPKVISESFFNHLPYIYETLISDAESIEKGDPAARNIEEVMRCYPGFYAICVYRFANLLLKLEVPSIPRILTELAHQKTGIDIHPAASIGKNFFIDHGTGIVIGETSTIGDHVKIYQGVTLGALSVSKELAETKRHPTIEDNVVIYAGATILGGKTVIGKNSIIGGNVWLTKSVEPNSTVYHQTELIINKS
jgi:serine O-acetyltransferase